MPRSSRSFIATCEHPGCHEILAVDGRAGNPKALMTAEGWSPVTRGTGSVTWLCPIHKPKTDAEAPSDAVSSKP